MAVDLLALEPQQISRDLRGKYALIYGSAGVGKTTLASKFEKSLICSFEMGSNALNNVYVQPVKTWSDWKSMVKQLCDARKGLQDKFYTICIDTADEAYKLCEKWLCSQHGVSEIKEVAAFGGGYKMLDNEFMSGFRDLTYAGYGLIFISHETEKPYKDDAGNEYNKIVPALPNRPFNLINKMVDIISYIRNIPVQEGEDIVYKRYMFFRSDERFLTKSRFKYIVPKVELDYNAYAQAIYDAVDKQVELSGGEATNEKNPYTVREFDELMEEAKEVWGKVVQAEKVEEAQTILAEEFNKPTKFSEILPEEIEQFSIALAKIKELV